MNLNNIDVVFFDMGNTLLNFHLGKTDVEKDQIGLRGLQRYIIREFKINYELEELQIKFLDKLDNHMINHRKKLGYEVEIDRFLIPLVNETNISSKTILEMSKAFYSQYMKEVQEEEGAVNVLEELKKRGKKIGIISNCFLPDEIYIKIFKEKGMYKYIDGYFFSYSNKCMKPRHEIFKKAMRDLNVKPEKCIMIGDNYKADIKPANELNMNSCLYNKNQKVKEYRDLQINNLGEILKWR